MNVKNTLVALFLFLLISCSSPVNNDEINTREMEMLPSIEGKTQYLGSPFVTAGDRVYLVGNQNGSFSELGWHIDGEMGGIWDHPIKLMDGFDASITIKGNKDIFCLNNADLFTNYPMANKHHFTWADEKIMVERFQFIPDSLEGAVIEYRIANSSTENKDITFSFTGMSDLRATWLGERTNMIDSEDQLFYDGKSSAVFAKDKNNSWFAIFGSTLKANGFKEGADGCSDTTRKGQGKNGTLSYSLTLQAGKQISIPFFIGGSAISKESLQTTFTELKEGYNKALTQKIERYKKISEASRLTIPDKKIEQMYEWLKYNTDWLTRNVPEQGVGLSAGLADYPWWFGCDNAYALQGVLATGNHALAKNTILLLNKISQRTNSNGRIVHEVSTNGSVYNQGNVNETAQFITLLQTYYAWTGDRDLLTQMYPEVKKGIDWLLKEKDPDGNGYPNGSGMMEIPGLDTEMIDVAAYTQQALENAAAIAGEMNEPSIAKQYLELANKLKIRINKEWWQEHDHSFGDFRGTVAEAKPVLEAAMIRADTLGKPWAVAELKETQKQLKKYPAGQQMPHVVYHNWVVNTPLETGIADPEKGKAALQTAKKYENPFGVFVTGIDRTEEADSVVLKSRKKIFSYTGAVMTLPTGVLAIASARYGTPEETLNYLAKLNQSFSFALPGSMYEVSPDFGMFTQSWNIYSVAVPIVNYFFGIQPRAFEQTIHLSPALPSAWKEASLDNVKVGDNSISVSFHQLADHKEYQILQTANGWKIIFDCRSAKKVVVNNKEINPKDLSSGKLQLTGGKNAVKIF
jgi:glycogen debranching enzyme